MVSDSERFRVEVDTNGFRSQFNAIGARELVRKLAFEGRYITSVVWLVSTGPFCECGARLEAGRDRCVRCLPSVREDVRFEQLEETEAA